jgi:ATP-dependent DNA helicase RecG
MVENSEFDRKSLLLFVGKTIDWKALAKDCVAFANGLGGEIHIGIEDKEILPSATQKVPDNLAEQINKTIPQLTMNVSATASIQVAENEGEYIILKIYRSAQAIASTSDGKYYIRIADECKPIMPDEMTRVAADKQAFIWEEKVARKIPLNEAPADKVQVFYNEIKASDRVSVFIKQMDLHELLEYYLLTQNGFLTNLGILWIGSKQHRTTLLYAPAIQFIKFDEKDKKVNKIVWDDFSLNPKELLNEVINNIPDWKESLEISEGIFRKTIPNYNIEVIRELIANALVHRVYTMRGDIFINLYTDRLEIHSPGTLPMGVTPTNIINKSVQRNTHLAKVFYDLQLMEKEGSGYDKVYEVLLYNGKPAPLVEEWDDRVVVTIKRNIISNNVVQLMSKANEDYGLKQKEIITLGLIAQSVVVTSTELSKKLNVRNSEQLQYWLGDLLKNDIVITKGKTKGTEYFINPEFLRQSGFKGKTDLKSIEPHRLQALIIADLQLHNTGSAISDIHERIGLEINRRKVKRMLDDMVSENKLYVEGQLKSTKYFYRP